MSISFFDINTNQGIFDQMVRDNNLINNMSKYKIFNGSDTFTLTSVVDIKKYKNGSEFIIPKEQIDYAKKKGLADSILSLYYSYVNEQMDEHFAHYLIKANEGVHNNTPLQPGEEFDVVLKGGGACRWYYTQLLNRLGKNMATMDYKEAISDIDVELYSKKMKPNQTNLLAVQICKWIMYESSDAIKELTSDILDNMNRDNKILPTIQNSKLYPNVITAKIKLPNLPRKDILIQKHGRYIFTSEVDNIILNDPIVYPGMHKQCNDCYISFTNEYELCKQMGDKFALARFNVKPILELTFANGSTQEVPIKLPLYDIGMGLNCSNGYLPKMGVKNPVIKIPDKLSVFTLEYVVKDLYAMLYVSNIFIWKFVKYEKRIKRLIFNIVLLDLDKFSKETVILNITACIQAFNGVVLDVNRSTTPENINNKITFLLVDSQKYRHLGSKLYMLMDGIILFYYFMLAKMGKCDSQYVKEFIDKYWGIDHCTSCNIIPIESKLKYEQTLTAEDYNNANEFKKNICKVLDDIIQTINQLF